MEFTREQMTPLAQATYRLTGNHSTPTPILAALVAAGLGPAAAAYAATDAEDEQGGKRWSIWAVDDARLFHGWGNAPVGGGEILDSYVRTIRLADITMMEVSKVKLMDGFDGVTGTAEVTFLDQHSAGSVDRG